MPDTEHDKPDVLHLPKDEKRRQQVIAGAGVIVAVLTYILIRKSSSNNAASSALPVSAPVQGSAGASVFGAEDFMNLQNQVYGLAGGLSALESVIGRTSSPTPISQSPNPTPTPTPSNTPTITNYPALPAIAGGTVVGGGYGNVWRTLQSFGSPSRQALAKQLEPNPAHVRSVSLATLQKGKGVGSMWGNNQPFDVTSN